MEGRSVRQDECEKSRSKQSSCVCFVEIGDVDDEIVDVIILVGMR